MADRSYRTADPYRDLDVIDARAPRANQTVVGLVALAGVVTGEWWLLALVAAQLALGLTMGRRWCVACSPCVACPPGCFTARRPRHHACGTRAYRPALSCWPRSPVRSHPSAVRPPMGIPSSRFGR